MTIISYLYYYNNTIFIGYFVGACIYNRVKVNMDALEYMIKFKENKLDFIEEKYIKSDWDACIYSFEKYKRDRIIKTIFWPLYVTNYMFKYTYYYLFDCYTYILSKRQNL